MNWPSSRRMRNKQNQKYPIVAEHIRENPEAFVESLAKGKRAIFRQLLYWLLRFPDRALNQTVLGRICGYTRKHVNEVLGEFEKQGIINMLYRHKDTSMYLLSKFFTPELFHKLTGLFGALPLALLVSFAASATAERKRLHNIKRVSYIYIKSVPIRETLNAHEAESDSERTKKEVEMETYELKSIKPTIAGWVRLSSFPKQAVLEVDKRMHRNKERPRNPWNYFVAAVNKYCQENGLATNWQLGNELKQKYNVTDEGPFVDESFVPSPPVYVPSRRTHSGYKSPSNQQEAVFDEVAHRNRIIAENKKLSESSHVDRNIENEILGCEAEVSLLAASKNPFAMMLMKRIESIKNGEDKPLASDKTRTENIMSKTHSPTHVSSFIQSVISSPMDAGYVDSVDDPFGDRH